MVYNIYFQSGHIVLTGSTIYLPRTWLFAYGRFWNKPFPAIELVAESRKNLRGTVSNRGILLSLFDLSDDLDRSTTVDPQVVYMPMIAIMKPYCRWNFDDTVKTKWPCFLMTTPLSKGGLGESYFRNDVFASPSPLLPPMYNTWTYQTCAGPPEIHR